MNRQCKQKPDEGHEGIFPEAEYSAIQKSRSLSVILCNSLHTKGDRSGGHRTR